MNSKHPPDVTASPFSPGTCLRRPCHPPASAPFPVRTASDSLPSSRPAAEPVPDSLPSFRPAAEPVPGSLPSSPAPEQIAEDCPVSPRPLYSPAGSHPARHWAAFLPEPRRSGELPDHPTVRQEPVPRCLTPEKPFPCSFLARHASSRKRFYRSQSFRSECPDSGGPKTHRKGPWHRHKRKEAALCRTGRPGKG